MRSISGSFLVTLYSHHLAKDDLLTKLFFSGFVRVVDSEIGLKCSFDIFI